MLYLIYVNMKSSFHEYQHNSFGYIHKKSVFRCIVFRDKKIFLYQIMRN